MQVFFFVLGMMLVVYGWRSFFKGLLDIEHNWVRLARGGLGSSYFLSALSEKIKKKQIEILGP